MKENVVLITGGHATTAIAVVEELKRKHPSWKIFWVGRKYALEGSSALSAEYSQIISMNIPFINLTTGRLQRRFSLHTIPSLLQFPIGVIRSLGILRKYEPSVIVSFGGYVALPVAIAGFFLGIPVITHEQTQTPGLANSIIARIAKKVCVSFPGTLSFFPKTKGLVTGIPIRQQIFTPPPEPSFPVPDMSLPLLYITGGSTGARSLNDRLFSFIPELLEKMTVIHQTGDASFGKADALKNRLEEKADRYSIAPFFNAGDVSWILHHAAVVLGRSGANTVAEVSALNIPAVFIPLPWAGGDEQTRNAKDYAYRGNAVVIGQDSLTEASLTRAIGILMEKMKQTSRTPTIVRNNGAVNMVRVIDEVLTKSNTTTRYAGN